MYAIYASKGNTRKRRRKRPALNVRWASTRRSGGGTPRHLCASTAWVVNIKISAEPRRDASQTHAKNPVALGISPQASRPMNVRCVRLGTTKMRSTNQSANSATRLEQQQIYRERNAFALCRATRVFSKTCLRGIVVHVRAANSTQTWVQYRTRHAISVHLGAGRPPLMCRHFRDASCAGPERQVTGPVQRIRPHVVPAKPACPMKMKLGQACVNPPRARKASTEPFSTAILLSPPYVQTAHPGGTTSPVEWETPRIALRVPRGARRRFRAPPLTHAVTVPLESTLIVLPRVVSSAARGRGPSGKGSRCA